MSSVESFDLHGHVPVTTERLTLVDDVAAHAGLPDYNALVVDGFIQGKTHAFDGGLIVDRLYRMSDKTTYNMELFLPSRHDRHDVMASATTPWCTDVKGFNSETGKALAQDGTITALVGPEASKLARATYKLARTIFGNTSLLAHDAWVQHAIMDQLDTEDMAIPDKAIGFGDSRGAMTNFGIQAYSAEHGRRMIYNDINDPCIEHKVTDDGTDIAGLAAYLGIKEPRELLRAIRQYRLGELPNLAKTVRFSPSFWVNQVATGFALFSGEAGSFVDHIPGNSASHVTLFSNSELNHHESWQRRLAPFKNIVTEVRPGLHLTLADPAVHARTVTRINRVQDVLHGVSADELSVSQLVESVRRYR